MFEIECEKYDQIKLALEEMLGLIKDIKALYINGTSYNVDFFLGGDLKFIAMIFGIQCANAHHSCPWCHFDSSIAVDIVADEWPITRTHEMADICMNTLGYDKKAIVDFIPFLRVILDTLHLGLRITDKIFEAFVKKLGEIDGNQNSNNWNLFIVFILNLDLFIIYVEIFLIFLGLFRLIKN